MNGNCDHEETKDEEREEELQQGKQNHEMRLRKHQVHVSSGYINECRDRTFPYGLQPAQWLSTNEHGVLYVCTLARVIPYEAHVVILFGRTAL